MSTRVQVILDEAEKEQIRRLADKEGLSLSAWFRKAARERIRASRDDDRIETPEDLREFFEECDETEAGREPNWEQHLDVIRASIRGTSFM